MDALLASHNQRIYTLTIRSVCDIADTIRDAHIEALPAGHYDFWVTPSLRPGHRLLNRPATRMLLKVGLFTARTVPLLRGVVVVTGRDHNGHIHSLSDQQISQLASAVHERAHPADWMLNRRLRSTERADRRRARSERNTANKRRAKRIHPGANT